MSTLVRKQIYLEREQVQQLELEAQEEYSDFSKLVRKAVDLFLKKKSTQLNWNADPLTKAVGSIHLTTNNASKKHDAYLYE